jgi:hypothetical protein
MWDSAYKGLDAIAIREFGDKPVFLDWNAGREAMIAYLVAASQRIFGTTVISVRIVVALTGCFTLACQSAEAICSFLVAVSFAWPDSRLRIIANLANLMPIFIENYQGRLLGSRGVQVIRNQ